MGKQRGKARLAEGVCMIGVDGVNPFGGGFGGLRGELREVLDDN